MKLDIFTNQWLDIVFEGRNKAYGAYELRKSNNKTTVRALIFGAIVFALAVSMPLILSLLPDSSEGDETLDTKIVSIKLPPKEEIKKDVPPPPPPPPKVDQVKFVKPVVAKAEEVVVGQRGRLGLDGRLGVGQGAGHGENIFRSVVHVVSQLPVSAYSRSMAYSSQSSSALSRAASVCASRILSRANRATSFCDCVIRRVANCAFNCCAPSVSFGFVSPRKMSAIPVIS